MSFTNLPVLRATSIDRSRVLLPRTLQMPSLYFLSTRAIYPGRIIKKDRQFRAIWRARGALKCAPRRDCGVRPPTRNHYSWYDIFAADNGWACECWKIGNIIFLAAHGANALNERREPADWHALSTLIRKNMSRKCLSENPRAGEIMQIRRSRGGRRGIYCGVCKISELFIFNGNSIALRCKVGNDLIFVSVNRERAFKGGHVISDKLSESGIIWNESKWRQSATKASGK